jgi:hypothetical protein
MTTLTQEQKYDYICALYNRLAQLTHEVEGELFIESGAGSVGFDFPEREYTLYCSPAWDQYGSDEPFKDDDTIDIVVEKIDYDGASDGVTKEYPILLCWNDIEQDIRTYLTKLDEILV